MQLWLQRQMRLQQGPLLSKLTTSRQRWTMGGKAGMEASGSHQVGPRSSGRVIVGKGATTGTLESGDGMAFGMKDTLAGTETLGQVMAVRLLVLVAEQVVYILRKMSAARLGRLMARVKVEGGTRR